MIHKCTLPSTLEMVTVMCKEEMERGDGHCDVKRGDEKRRGEESGERKNRKVEGEMLPAE
jgi:hypothetical protein